MNLPRGVFVAHRRGSVKAVVAEVACLLDGKPVKVGDVVCEDEMGIKTVWSRSSFEADFDPENPDRTVVHLEELRQYGDRAVEKAWVDVDIVLSVALERGLRLQAIRGARKETAECVKKLREALMWLRARPGPLPSLYELAKDADALAKKSP